MNTVLWVLQGVLALMMLMPGFMKIMNPNDQLKEKGNGRMDWVDDVSSTNLTLIGIVEMLIGFGLILPMLLDLFPWLTPLAAIGAILTMIGAIALHVRRKDGMKAISVNVVILLIAAIITYGRFELFNAI